LALAERKNFVVIEDDYEAENLYQGQPMPALKSLDKVGRVIYVGSVSKSLSPSLRLGYIVAPRALIAELRELRHAMLRHPSAFLQHAFALFLSLGHHADTRPPRQFRDAGAHATRCRRASRAPAGFCPHVAVRWRVRSGSRPRLGLTPLSLA
jgi:DNA-binding transcriptional MocR family regulator